MNLTELAARLLDVAVKVDVGKEEALRRSARILQESAKAAIGSYTFGWPQLARSTQDDRVRKGFAPNEPLLRTGELRESIHCRFSGGDAYVYTRDKYAYFHEFGTRREPPRSFLGAALAHERKRIEEVVGERLASVFTGK